MASLKSKKEEFLTLLSEIFRESKPLKTENKIPMCSTTDLDLFRCSRGIFCPHEHCHYIAKNSGMLQYHILKVHSS
jgi:hypothetical protein